jgi:thymidine phosphorylase
MNFPEVIERKREGGATRPEELAELIRGLLDDTLPLYQISAWLMAVVFRGMERAETANFTRLMMESGEVLDFSDLPGIPVDKHSTGGVGDKISIPLAPAVAAAGAYIPMISGRGLGHTGGTLDKLESIPGLRTDLEAAAFRSILKKLGFAIIGAGPDLAPADSRLYALRDVTGTVPSVPLITASILSKKYAAGVDALVLDVKCGSGAFMPDLESARELARVLVEVSAEMGKPARALVTTMDAPLGQAVGNALEIRAEMLVLARVATDRDDARSRLADALASGAALDRFRRWVEAQHGDPAAIDDPDRLPRAPVIRMLEAPRAGWLSRIDGRAVGFAANALGAGRAKVGDRVDPAVGFVFRSRVGAPLEKGTPIAEIHARDEDAARQAGERLLNCVEVGDEEPELPPLLREAVGAPAGS